MHDKCSGSRMLVEGQHAIYMMQLHTFDNKECMYVYSCIYIYMYVDARFTLSTLLFART